MMSPAPFPMLRFSRILVVLLCGVSLAGAAEKFTFAAIGCMPYMRYPYAAVAFTRVETFGAENFHGVIVSVDPASTQVFIAGPLLVPGNPLPELPRPKATAK